MRQLDCYEGVPELTECLDRSREFVRAHGGVGAHGVLSALGERQVCNCRSFLSSVGCRAVTLVNFCVRVRNHVMMTMMMMMLLMLMLMMLMIMIMLTRANGCLKSNT